MSSLPIENLPPTPAKFYKKKPISTCKHLIEAFSTNKRRRHPSWANKDKDAVSSSQNSIPPIHIRLITIGPSHYCEKARWALDLTESNPDNPYYYTEDAHPPVFAGIATLEASNNRASITPMVIIDSDASTNTTGGSSSSSSSSSSEENKVIYDSHNIVKYFCPQLYPISKNDEIMKFEKYLGLHLGATARIVMYHHLLRRPYYNVLTDMLTVHSSSIEKFLWGKLLDKGLKHGMKKTMNVNANSANISLKEIRNVFQIVSDKLRLDDYDHNNNDDDSNSNNNYYNKNLDSIKQIKKKEYLMDTNDEKVGFTAADLTFASLAAPLIGPPEIAPFIEVKDDRLPKELIDLKYELRGTLAGQHVLEMYRKHRLSGTTTGTSTSTMVTPKVVLRDKVPRQGVILSAAVVIGSVVASSFQNNGQSFFQSRL